MFRSCSFARAVAVELRVHFISAAAAAAATTTTGAADAFGAHDADDAVQ